MSSRVQSLVFDRDLFNEVEAITWALDHHYSARKIEVKPNTIRLRQHAPDKSKRYRAKKLGRYGVTLVLEFDD